MNVPADRNWTDGEQADICRVIEAALPHTGVSIICQDVLLGFLWARNIHPALAQGFSDSGFDLGAEGDVLAMEARAALASGERRTLELHFTRDRKTYWFHVVVEPRFGDAGQTTHLVTTMVDVTDRKRREQTLSTLLREVSHRSKNLLAIILSIAGQTGRYSRTVDVFLARFRGRIQSLAYSQDLVTSSNWRGAGVHELLMQQTARYSADPQRNIRFEGPDVNLNPNATLHVGLGLHELAVNSVSFGALSRTDGSINVSTEIEPGGSLLLHWSEQLHAASPASILEKRFGSVALERVVPAAVDGAATLGISNGRLDYRLTIPPHQFDAG